MSGRDGSSLARAGLLRWALTASLGAAALAGCGSTVAPQASSPPGTTVVGILEVDPSPGTNTPTVSVPDDFRVERRTWGGMCAGGPCGSTFVATADGHWVLSSNGRTTTGTLSRQQVIALTMAVRVTQLQRATGVPDCAANRDGTSVAYAWTYAGTSGSASSCKHPINLNDSLPIEVERVAQSVIP
ncbi:hypothetical protein [Intrasporangium sp. YIM S08009]|uniref:hypothetical protein n=1 Tax=Intrasporangium zincisolvens TaxID=3080018 RepID=UPI002B054226|nr:hypothetical protein [Intrasporangium sp. YIM S08009]